MASSISVWLLVADDVISDGIVSAVKKRGAEVVRGAVPKFPNGGPPDVVVCSSEQYSSLSAKLEAAKVDLSLPVLFLGTKIPAEAGPTTIAFSTKQRPDKAELTEIANAALLLALPVEGGKREGTLKDFPSLFSIAGAVARFSGDWKLGVSRGLRKGTIEFSDGMLCQATLGSFQGEAAFRHMLLWTESRLVLSQGAVEKKCSIPREQLFERSTRFLESLGEVSKVRASDCYLANSASIRRLGARLPGRVQEIVDLFDGARSVADVIQDSPYRAIEVVRVTAELLDRGLLLARGSNPDPNSATLLVEEWHVERDPVDGTTAGELPVMPKGKSIPSKNKTDSHARVVQSKIASGEIEHNVARQPGSSHLGLKVEVHLPAQEKEKAPQISKEEPLFSDDERAFFERGKRAPSAPVVETFDDLDEDIELPKTFWGRFFRDPNASIEVSEKRHRPRKRGRTRSGERASTED